MYFELVTYFCDECQTQFQMNEINGQRPYPVWCTTCTANKNEEARLVRLKVKKNALNELKAKTIEERIGIIEEELYNLRIKQINSSNTITYPPDTQIGGSA